MRVLLDTHLLLWAATEPERLPVAAIRAIEDPANQLLFSVSSLWEIGIKTNAGRDDFRVDPSVLRRNLLDNGYAELPIVGAHVIAVQALPPIHRDPFDRILIAQAIVEGVTLLTSDRILSQYPGPIQRV